MPTQSKHPKEAAELVRFLTSPKGQVAAFKAVNNLPSSPAALDDPAGKGVESVRPIRDEIEQRVRGLLADLGPDPAGEIARRPRRR